MATQENSLPPYPEMIMDAIDALNEKMGSNKTSISKCMESKYQTLPAGHAQLLKHHLNMMKDHGRLIFWKNNYMRPTPDFVRRGRGRPPKAKETGMPTSGAPGSAKPKERQRNDDIGADDGSAASVPLKKKKVSPDNNYLGVEGQPLLATKTGRGRGRPPKAKPQPAGEGVSTQA